MPKGVPNKRYTPEFKKHVVETMIQEGLSYRETERRFELPRRRAAAWERIYLEEGPEGFLVERRGRELLKERTTRDEAELKKAERTRLAVELHDALSQNLTGIALQLDAAELTAEKNNGSDLPHLRKIRIMMQSCRDNLKNCLWDLRNLAIDQPFLSDSIRMTLSPVVGATELSIDFPVRTRNLSDNIIHAILCMIRELAVNAVRHGKATHIDIHGWLSAAGIGFTVKDDGCVRRAVWTRDMWEDFGSASDEERKYLKQKYGEPT